MPVLDEITLTIEELSELFEKAVPCEWEWDSPQCVSEAHWLCSMSCNPGSHTEKFTLCHKHKDMFLERDWFCSLHKLSIAEKRVEAL